MYTVKNLTYLYILGGPHTLIMLLSAAQWRWLRLCGCTRAMAAYSKYLTVRHSAIVGGTAAACALLCLLNKRRAAAQHG